MKNIILSVDIESRAVVTSKDFAGISGEHLQNDIVVKFNNNEFVDGTGYFEVIIDDHKYAIEMDKNASEKTYSLPVKSSLLQKAGNLICQFTVRKINEVGIFKSVRFSLPVLYAINAIDTIEDDYKTWAQQIEEDIESLNDSVETINENIEQVNENIEQLNNDVGLIQNDIININDDIAGINDNISEINNDIVEMSEDIEELNGDIFTINEDINGINENVTELNEDIVTVSDDLSDFKDEVEADYLKKNKQDLSTARVYGQGVDFTERMVQYSPNAYGQFLIQRDANGFFFVNDPTQAQHPASKNYADGLVAPIRLLIPAQASANNQLADKNFVNSSIATNTANFIGTFANVTALNNYAGTITNNDYAFVINSVINQDFADVTALNAYDKTLLTNFDYAWVINGTKFDLYRFDITTQTWELRVENTTKDAVTLNTAYNRYKYTSANTEWGYEYTLNNSSFTASQWEAINSGITSLLVGKITTNETNITTIGNTVNGILANYVTTNTDQDIEAIKTIKDTTLQFANSEASGGAKWVHEEDKYGQFVVSRIYNNIKETFWAYNGLTINPNRDNANNFGSVNRRLKDVYVAGVLSDGTNSISVANIANKNDVMFKSITLTSTTLTAEQVALIQNNNCILTADLSVGGTTWPAGAILTRPFVYSNSLRGLIIYNSKIKTYLINTTNNTIGLGATDTILSNVAQFNDKPVPNYPASSTGTYNLQYVNGALVWNTDNYLTTDTAQTITGKKTIRGDLEFQQSSDSGGTSKLSIKNDNGYNAKIRMGNTENIRLMTGGTYFGATVAPITDNATDLGVSNTRWKDGYFAGVLSDGTNSVAIADIASTTYVDTKIGDIDTLLTALNSGSGV